MSFSTIVLVIKADRRLKAESNADNYRIQLGLPQNAARIKVKFYFAPDFVAFNR